jgi:hypothetical protein
MAKAKRVARSREDLKRELHDQLQLLRMACENYDRGFEVAGRQIALTLRVLLYTYKRSRGLLDQLGYRDRRFYTSAQPYNPNNLLVEMPMFVMSVGPSGAQYKPLIHAPAFAVAPRYQLFPEWWNETIIRDDQGYTFSRMSIVMNVADTDGGAHVDPELDEDYMALTRGNSLGWFNSATGKPFSGKPELACVRQIAHEVLMTMHESVPEYRESATPVVPAVHQQS